jgi:Right handed beta helix region
MSLTVTRSGNQGPTPYKTGSAGLDPNTLLDFETATFILDNQPSTIDGDGTSYWPVDVRNSPGVIIDGGTIQGEINMTGDWRTVYDYGNSAGVTVQYSPGVIIRDWRMTNVFDGVNISRESSNFLVEDVWITGARDDAIQNDKLNSGTIRDSLFDGVFAGISLDPSSSSPVDGRNNVVTIDGVLMRLNLQNYEGEMTHASWIKTDSATLGAVTPHLRVFNTVVAIEDPTHHSFRSTADAWKYQIDGANNFYLNLSDTPLPSDYPMPPSGSWTVLQGQAARDYWNQAKTEWIADHEGDGGTTAPTPVNEPPPVESVSTDTPTVPDATTASGSDTTGTTTGSSPSTGGTSTATDGSSTTSGTSTTTGSTSTATDGTSTAGGTSTTTGSTSTATDGTSTAGGTSTTTASTSTATDDTSTTGGTSTTTEGTSTTVSSDSALGGHHWWQQTFGNSSTDNTSTTVSPDSARGGHHWWEQAFGNSTAGDRSTTVSPDSTSEGLGHHWRQTSADLTTSALASHDWQQHANFWHH